MSFPETERVIYRRNPLKSVTCQLRFPLDLRIDITMPAEFQQKIQNIFPNAQEATDANDISVPKDVSQHFPTEVIDALSARINRRFQFQTRDRTWTITLTNDFVALETSGYVRWEDFREKIELVLSAVCETYKPSFFTRLGLRYQNVVDKNALGLKDVAWNELLSEFVLGPLAVPEYVELAQEHNGTFLIQLDNFQDVVRVQYGLVTEKSGDPANILFMLDQDFFTKNNVETEASDVFKRLDVYNSSNRRLFRSCIKDRLHAILVPESTLD